MKRDLLLDGYLKRLKMPTVAREYPKVAAKAAKANKPYEAFLLALLEAEVATRESNAVKKRIANAGFPRIKEIAEYDFTQIPGLKKQKILQLTQCDYLQRQENIVFMGKKGNGEIPSGDRLGAKSLPEGASRQLFHRRIPDPPAHRSPNGEKASSAGETDRQIPASDHRRVGLCPSDPKRGATPLRDRSPALRTGLGDHHDQSGVPGVDQGLCRRETDGRAPRPVDPSMPGVPNERGVVPFQDRSETDEGGASMTCAHKILLDWSAKGRCRDMDPVEIIDYRANGKGVLGGEGSKTDPFHKEGWNSTL